MGKKQKKEIRKFTLTKNDLGVIKLVVTKQYTEYLENKLDKLEEKINK